MTRNREALAAPEPLRRWLAAEPDLVLGCIVNLAVLDWAVTPRQKRPAASFRLSGHKKRGGWR